MCERVPIYREQWEAAFGGDLECQCERGNAADAYAVSVVRGGSMIGHLTSCMHAFCKKRRGSMDEDSDLGKTISQLYKVQQSHTHFITSALVVCDL